MDVWGVSAHGFPCLRNVAAARVFGIALALEGKLIHTALKKPDLIPLLVPRNIAKTVALNNKRFKISDAATSSGLATSLMETLMTLSFQPQLSGERASLL